MTVKGLEHINIDTALPDETIAFYTDVMGLTNRPDLRPDFGFPGAWLFCGEQAIVHLNFRDAQPEKPTGAFNHIAFEGTDYATMTKLLDQLGLEYKAAERPEIQLKQIFVRDPNNVLVEINIRG